jgi:hypothetical protein
MRTARAASICFWKYSMVQSQVTLQTVLASHKMLEFISLWLNSDYGVLPWTAA